MPAVRKAFVVLGLWSRKTVRRITPPGRSIRGGQEEMNINEAVEKIMDLETKCFYPDWGTYKTAIADILQELLDTVA